MDFSEFAFRLLLLFFPGIVAAILVDQLASHKKREQYEHVVLAFVHGVIAYMVFFVLIAFVARFIYGNWPADGFGITPITESGAPRLNIRSVIGATVVAVFYSLALSAAINHKLLHRFAQSIKVTTKFAESDVWDFALNSSDVRWAVLRDYERCQMYEGYVIAFSDVEDVRELLLLGAVVYDETTGAKLYSSERLYLSRNRDDLTIEFPSYPRDQEAGEEHEQRDEPPTPNPDDRGQDCEGGAESSSDDDAPPSPPAG